MGTPREAIPPLGSAAEGVLIPLWDVANAARVLMDAMEQDTSLEHEGEWNALADAFDRLDGPGKLPQ